MTRSAYERIGGLDDGFFMYMEEVDWCRRAQRAGLSIRYVPEARFVHSRQHASRGTEGRTYLYKLRSRGRYFRKHHRPPPAWEAKAILAASLALKWICVRSGAVRAEDPGVYVRGMEAVWAA